MSDMVHNSKTGGGRFGVGASLRRKEDDALITGKGRFSDDVVPDASLYSYVLRSPYAHAKFIIEDVEVAKKSGGVHLVLTATDVTELKPLSSNTGLKDIDGNFVEPRDIPILCDGIVRHVGDAICFIVAGSIAQARDAAELIEIDFEMLPAIADTATALNADVPLVYEGSKSNKAFTFFMGDQEDTNAAFENAEHIVDIDIINPRLIANYIEPRACVGEWDANNDEFKFTVCSQGVHLIQRCMARCLGVDKKKIQVITPDVGGAFGTKIFFYREYALTLEAARRLNKPVKWTSDRSEHFVADAHGRDNVVTAQMAMDAEGKFLAVKVNIIAAMGAYLHAEGPFIPYLGMTMTTGLYDIPAMAVTCHGIYTNTTPTDAYRGAGRPEAAYLIERLTDKCAFTLNITPDEIRRRNFIQPDQLPYHTQGGRIYDTGEFEAHMITCMHRAKWDSFEARNIEAKTNGKIRGIGMGTYIEACAFAGSEPAFIRLQDDGKFFLRIGTQSSGQGHQTAYAQLAAEKFGVDIEEIEVHQGDTKVLGRGGGTGGSRSIPLGGVSTVHAAQALAKNMKVIAAKELEVSAIDIELEDGIAKAKGTNLSIAFSDIAKAASEEERNTKGEFVQEEATYPNGTHICEVEIDPDTGVTKIVAYTIVDDFGKTVNPLLLEGQVHGGVVQAIGQCLNERTVYDEEGQLLTASFMDYGVPRASDIPSFHFETRNVPSTTNAMGMKGAGEAGTIGACPAVMNAVVDALRREYNITHFDMPCTPEKMWHTIEQAKSIALDRAS